MRGTVVQTSDRPNVLVVSVRLAKKDVEELEGLAGRYGVGLSTYIRMLVREHLEKKESAPFGNSALVEVAAARAPETSAASRGVPEERSGPQRRLG